MSKAGDSYIYIYICTYIVYKQAHVYIIHRNVVHQNILHIPWNPWLGTTCVPEAVVVLGSEPVGPMRRCAAAAGVDMYMNLHGKRDNVFKII